MNTSGCVREKIVRNAAVSGDWNEELRAHLTACSLCAEVAGVSRSLAELASERLPAGELPDPGFLWWQAELRGRRAGEKRATQPLELTEAFSALIAAVSLTAGLFWQWPRIKTWLGSASPGWFQSLSSLGWTSGLLVALLGLSVLLFVLSIRLVFRTVFSEK